MRRNSLLLEVLEDRCVPATVQFYSGILEITRQTGALTLTQTANNNFTIQDGAKSPVMVSGVSNIYVIGSSSVGNLTLNLGTYTYSGSLVSSTTNGSATIDIEGNGGSLRGDATIVHQTGSITVDVDSIGAGALTVGGNFLVAGTPGNNSITFGNSSNLLTILGTTSLTNVNNIAFNGDQGEVFGGNFSANIASNYAHYLNVVQESPTVSSASPPLSFNGSLSLTGGPLSDVVTINSANIAKNLSVNLGASPPGTNSTATENSLNLSTNAAAGNVTVNGCFTYTGTGSNDALDLSGSFFNGSVVLNLGTGNEEVDIDNSSAETYFSGNFTVNTTGSLDFTTLNGNATGGIEAIFFGNVTFNLGNGDANIPFNDTATVAGTIYLHARNGDIQLSFNGATNYSVAAFFGNGDNTVTLDNADANLTGILDAGNGSNMFNLTAGTIVQPFTLIGF